MRDHRPHERLNPVRLLTVRRFFTFLCLLACAVQISGRAHAEQLSDAQAQALVTRSLAAELKVARDPDHPMRFLLHRSTPRLTTTKEIIETRDGNVARLLSVNGKPLAPEDDQKELQRLATLAANPSMQEHRKDDQDGNTRNVIKLLRMMPKAFIYRYAGSYEGPTGTVQRFTFKPDPKFDPPDWDTQALTTMSGELSIDEARERVIRLEVHLDRDTNYGWGILGKLSKGGWLLLEQSEVGDGQWRIVNVQLRMTLRILFRTREMDTSEQMSNYRPVPPNMDYRKAIAMLREGSAAVARSGK
jgi:hypothetical protein